MIIVHRRVAEDAKEFNFLNSQFKTLRSLRLCGEHHFLKRLNCYEKPKLEQYNQING